MLAHLLAGLEQVLSDVGESLVPGGIRVVGDHGNPGREGLFGRRVERCRVDQSDGDPVDPRRNRAVERVGHLRDDAVGRSRPLVGAPEQLARVRSPALRGGEEHIGRDVVYERELVALAGAEDARCGAPAAGCARARARARAARLEDHRRDPGGAAGERGPAGEMTPPLEGGVVLLALVPFQSLDGVAKELGLRHRLSPLIGDVGSDWGSHPTLPNLGLSVQCG